MALPKIDLPIFETTLPSGLEVKFHPFRVKEEKLLLIAREAEDASNIVNTVRQIVQSCLIAEDINVSKLPSFDLEYLFVQMRAKSVGEIVDLFYRHKEGVNSKGEECDHVQRVQLKVDDIEVRKVEGHTQTIQLNEKYGIKLNYPTIEMVGNIDKNLNEYDTIISLVAQCIDCLYTDDSVFQPDSIQEAKEFIEDLNKECLEKLQKFFEEMPRNVVKVKYACEKCGETEEFNLETLSDFF